MNLYVGNLAREVTQEDLQVAFAAFGQVVSATVVKDQFSGESRGFGFVDMPSRKEAEAAMNGVTAIKHRMVTVNEARPRETGGRGFKGRGKGSGRGHGSNSHGGWR